jgi:hypothetical protein
VSALQCGCRQQCCIGAVTIGAAATVVSPTVCLAAKHNSCTLSRIGACWRAAPATHRTKATATTLTMSRHALAAAKCQDAAAKCRRRWRLLDKDDGRLFDKNITAVLSNLFGDNTVHYERRDSDQPGSQSKWVLWTGCSSCKMIGLVLLLCWAPHPQPTTSYVKLFVLP